MGTQEGLVCEKRRLRGIEMRRIKNRDAFFQAWIRAAIEWDREEFLRHMESQSEVIVDETE